MRTVVVLFTRDLRVHDQQALAQAVERAERVVPLFVLDDRLLANFGAPNRVAFLLDSLQDLRRSLESRGGGLAIRRGDVVAETARFALEQGAEAVYISEDVTAYAQERERRLEHALAGARIALETFPGVTVVPPGELAPSGSDHFRVFTPYWQRWRLEQRRPVLGAPERIRVRAGIEWGRMPARSELVPGVSALDLPPGGETAARERLDDWIPDGLARYAERRDDLAADATSGLSPYLHFGCVSPGEVVDRSLRAGEGEAFVRQLCWRDFHHQLLAARPSLARNDMHPRGVVWEDDDEALQAWKEGRTGYPIIDAGMRQLLREGWMHNRARLVTGSFLTKHLRIDWRAGAAHFFEHLVDGDVANNTGNWQWVAGTGADSRPYRMLSPQRQAERFDPYGVYVRRYVAEYDTDAYPDPIVDHREAVARFRDQAVR
ncbi:MAG: DNA photolyase family protein [Actinomycetota bacterium]|nr:DNA photolyase family protein [Actinomycetota bacterium]